MMTQPYSTIQPSLQRSSRTPWYTRAGQHTWLLLLLLLLQTLLASAAAPPVATSPVRTTTAAQEIRSLYPSEWGIAHVRGVGYAWTRDQLFLLDKLQNSTTQTTVTTITPFEDGIGTITLAFGIDDPLNVTFDNGNERLLLLNNESQQIATVTLGNDGVPDPATLQRFDISGWQLETVRGISMDRSGQSLYLLESATHRVIRARFPNAQELTDATLTPIDLPIATDSLSGLAVQPFTGNLFVGDAEEYLIYEVTATGQLQFAHTLWHIGVTDLGGFTFMRSADRTDPEDVLHLAVANSNLPGVTLAADGQSAPVASTVYLPLIHTEDTAQTQGHTAAPSTETDTAATAAFFGELMEVALCEPDCGTPVLSVSRRIAQGSDDAEELIPTGEMYELTSTDLELTDEHNGPQLVGLRFQDILIPAGATVRYASLEFVADETGTVETHLLFQGEAVGDASTFTWEQYDISSRMRTAAGVPWENIRAWNTINAKYRTPDLAAIVQEIVDRGDWQSGNALVFLISGDGTRTAESFEGAAAAAPKLYIEFTTPEGSAPTPTPVPSRTPSPIVTPTATAPAPSPTATAPASSPTAVPTATAAPTGNSITAKVETAPVPHSGDAADDPAIWIHPNDPARSTIIGTDKEGGIAVYDLAGNELQYRADGAINNVDLRYDFPLGDKTVAVVAASNQSHNSIALYRVDPGNGHLINAATRRITSGVPEIIGLCMYHSPVDSRYYVIVNDLTEGAVEQWEIFDNGSGEIDAKLVRSFTIGYQSEGCVADDEYANLYIASEEVGIWQYGAEPSSGEAHTLIDRVGSAGHLTADVEGLAIYRGADGSGYLIASSQGNNRFVLYERGGGNGYITSFAVAASSTIDRVTHTDGIEVTNVALGPEFPNGLFVVQDDINETENGQSNQNFKLVPWETIATNVEPPLLIDPDYQP